MNNFYIIKKGKLTPQFVIAMVVVVVVVVKT